MRVAFDTVRAVAALAALCGLLALSLLASPMPVHGVIPVRVVSVAFGGAAFYVGYRYGRYRAGRD